MMGWMSSAGFSGRSILGREKNDEFCVKTRNCVSKTRNCVSKTRNCTFKMMDVAGISQSGEPVSRAASSASGDRQLRKACLRFEFEMLAFSIEERFRIGALHPDRITFTAYHRPA